MGNTDSINTNLQKNSSWLGLAKRKAQIGKKQSTIESGKTLSEYQGPTYKGLETIKNSQWKDNYKAQSFNENKYAMVLQNNSLFAELFDEDQNGIAEFTIEYGADGGYSFLQNNNNTGVTNFRQVFDSSGAIQEEFVDADGNGIVESKRVFGADGSYTITAYDNNTGKEIKGQSI